MKRLYIAAALIIISLLLGIFTGKDIKSRSVKHLKNIKKIEAFLNKKDFINAEKTAKKTADDFYFNDSSIMYSYYIHKDLSDIGENLYSMHGYIKRKKLNEYYYVSTLAKSKLLSLIKREDIEIQNLL